MSDIQFVLALCAAAAFGYACRAIIARFEALPEDLERVAEAFGSIDVVYASHEAGIGAEAEKAFPLSGHKLGATLVDAARARGMNIPLLLGFIASADISSEKSR